jgi:hypothetical protein
MIVRRMLFLLLLCLAAGAVRAQDAEAVQVHGFATQGFIYSSRDNYLTSRTSEGEPGWTEAVVSITDTPVPKLRIGVQLHYFRLGDLGSESPQIDWALGDYKVNDYFGIRAGKVKTPLGLFNDTQDIDAVFLWSLLPQSTYTIDNRSFFLAHLGGEIYGSVPLGRLGGKLSYRGYGGENSLSNTGGYTEQLRTLTGLQFTDPIRGPVYGADLRWQTAYQPLMLGASFFDQHITGEAPTGGVSFRTLIPAYYAQFDKGRFYAAGEYRRQPNHGILQVGPYQQPFQYDQRQWFAMTSFRATKKLQVGTYYSHQSDPTLPKYQQGSVSKDFVLSARYDFNANFYAKTEGHFLHGTAIGFYPDDNPMGVNSRTNLVIGKIGFDF